MPIWNRIKQPVTGEQDAGTFGGASNGPLMGYDIAVNESLSTPVIGPEQVREAMQTLMKYKAGKANFEHRVIENEEWWKMRHWSQIKERGTTTLEAKSAWLVNVILSKHADAMDATPEPNCLPRAQDDEMEAKMLSKIVPTILQQNNFDLVWSDNWWKKLKAGVAFYGVFWDKDALNGLGDIAVRKIDPLSLFWEPGVTDLQDSRNIFHVSLVDNQMLVDMYPELEGKLNSKGLTLNEYLYDDNVDTSEKSPVVDWYYKKTVGGKTVLHYVKFVGESVLYATENEAGSAGGMNGGIGWTESSTPLRSAQNDMTGSLSPALDGAGDPMADYTPPSADSMTERGIYDHGMYPFFADVLFPEEGTPTGYGYVDICKDSQRQIDLMNNAIVANAIASATPRWMTRGDGKINEEEYADWTRPFVHVQGSLDETAIRQISVNAMPGNLLAVLQNKIEEMKETSGNRDVNNGGTASGVTAASAIAAMQEQSGKLSRDQIQNSYNCYRQIVYCVIELIRQFYDMPRQFRIIGDNGQAEFVQFDNSGLQIVQQGPDALGLNAVIRKPVFDIEVSAQKQSAYNKLSYNELAIQFYQLGFFNPQAADPALAALEMMDFKGKEKVRERIQKNGGMMQMIQALMMENQALKAQLGIQTTEQDAEEGSGRQSAVPTAGSDGKAAKALPNNTPNGEPVQQNRYIEKGRASAQAATQPR